MEMKDRGSQQETLRHGDVRLPEVTGFGGRGPSRAKVMLHLAGIGLGFLLLMVGVGLGLSRDMWDRLALIPVIVGGALVAGWVTINYSFLATMLRNRRVMVGTNALFMALLGAVLLTAVNFVSTRHYGKWDLTPSGRNTLSPKTRQLLENLDQEVAVISFRVASMQTANEETFLRLQDLMRLYTEFSDKVTVQYINVDMEPDRAQMAVEKYGIDVNYGLMADEVFVIAGDRKKRLRLGDMMEWESSRNPMNPYQSRPLAFKGEQYISSAILEVTEAKQPKIYVLSGHGERSITDASFEGLMDLAGNLKRDNFQIEELPTVPAGGVPADCDCLVIPAPKVRLARDEVERIGRYLEGGGRALVCLEVRTESGLEGLLAQWGARVGDDMVITQDARALVMANSAVFKAWQYGTHEITAPLEGFAVVFSFARSVTADAAAARAEVAKLVETSPESYAEGDVERVFSAGETEFDPDVDAKGPISIGVAVEERVPPGVEAAGGPVRKARMVVFGDVDGFANQIIKQARMNLDLCRNSLNWLVERKELIAIDSRPEIQHILVVDSAGRKAVFWYMVMGLPLLVLLMGGIVWVLRVYGSKAA